MAGRINPVFSQLNSRVQNAIRDLRLQTAATDAQIRQALSEAARGANRVRFQKLTGLEQEAIAEKLEHSADSILAQHEKSPHLRKFVLEILSSLTQEDIKFVLTHVASGFVRAARAKI